MGENAAANIHWRPRKINNVLKEVTNPIEKQTIIRPISESKMTRILPNFSEIVP